MMFGKRLHVLRIENDLTLDELAANYNSKYSGGLNKGTISRYENGKQEPLFTVVKNFADYFNVSLDYLIGKEPITSMSKTDHAIINAMYDECDAEAQKNIRDYVEFQLTLSRQRQNSLDKVSHHSNR